ncbi:MAG: amidohydrolase family protein [Lentisphaerales bacterium]|nr:amidohydrolase family protein [Lentisphaerales bacterium]
MKYIIVLTVIFAFACQSKDSYSNIPIIDTHIHLYDTTAPEGIPWPPERDKVLYKPTLPANYKPVTVQNGIAATVVVEASHKHIHNKWLLNITAAESDHYTGIIANLPPGSPDFEKNLEELCKYDRFVGIRLRPIEAYPYFTEKFWRDITLLAKKGKTLDVLMKGINLKQVCEIAQKNPDLKIIINSLTGVSLKNKKSLNADWRLQVQECASYKNIYLKFSGFFGRSGMNPAPLSPDYYKECVAHLISAFGEDRLIYGSNWPVINKFGNYQDYKELVIDICRQYGQKFTEKVFYRNAIEFYGLPQLKLL